MSTLVITGTDTGVGKTVFAAGLTKVLGASYWKPVQAGLDEQTDTETVRILSGQTTLPEAYRLNRPISPHLAAKDMGIVIEPASLSLPKIAGPLIVEGAGGVMVPLTYQHCFLDLFRRWEAPIILVARTALGTINHTALSLMALRNAGCTIAGVAFVGGAEPDVEQTITETCRVRNLGRLPYLSDLSQRSLSNVFAQIDVDAIRNFL